MTINLTFTKVKLVKLEQILAQYYWYASGNTDAVGGLDLSDLATIKTNAYNLRENIRKLINDYDTYDGTDVDADYTI